MPKKTTENSMMPKANGGGKKVKVVGYFASAIVGVIVTSVFNYFFPLFIITIEGRVVDSKNKNGIENARILLEAGHIFHKVASDQHGNFRIPDVRRGTYMLKVNADAYEPASQSIQISFLDFFPFNWHKTKSVEEIQLEQSPLPTEMMIKGEVKDIFDNPRKDVMVIIHEIKGYTRTDDKGQYYFSNIPHRDHMTLKARYGEESDSRRIEIATDAEVIEKAEKQTVIIKLPLVLEHPKIRLKAYLCKRVVDHEPQQIFEEENPDIPTDIGTIWCFVRVFGPYGYQQRKKTQITYLWYWRGQLVHRYTQGVGFNPPPQGWRTCAFKEIGAQTGEWRLEIEAKHKQLACLYFVLKRGTSVNE